MAVGLENRGGDELYCPTCEQTFAIGERCSADNTRLVRITGPHDAMIGRELDGRYTITAQIGAGGMGAVYRGTQHQLGREVAIKVVTPSLVKDPIIIKRFLREAKLASRLSHPNAVGVVDFGQTDDGLFFLVMELVNGRTLEDIVATDGKLTPARVVRIGAQICDALEEAHVRQIVHRDLKPQNVMVMTTGRDHVKVLDFGLAKSLSPEHNTTLMTMTNAGGVLGTPAFIPPEVALGEDSDARADLYSLGCVLYVCAAGRLPFTSDSAHEVMAMHATEPPPPIDDIPPGLWSVIERLLEKEPAARYQSARDAREALEIALTAEPSRPTPAPVRALAPAPAPASVRASVADASATDGHHVAESSTMLGWDYRTPVPASRARIATPMGVPRVGVGASQVSAGDADLIASSATLPSDAIASELAAYPELVHHTPSRPTPRPMQHSTPHPSPATSVAASVAPARISWKAIALVLAAAIGAAVLAFVLVDSRGGSEPTKVKPTPPAAAPAPAKIETKIEAKVEAKVETKVEVVPPTKIEVTTPSAPPAPPAKVETKVVPPTPKPEAAPTTKKVVKKPLKPPTTVETKPATKPAAKPTDKPADKPTDPMPPRRPVKTNPGVM